MKLGQCNATSINSARCWAQALLVIISPNYNGAWTVFTTEGLEIECA